MHFLHNLRINQHTDNAAGHDHEWIRYIVHRFGTGMGKTVATMMNNSFKSQNNQDKSCQLQKN